MIGIQLVILGKLLYSLFSCGLILFLTSYKSMISKWMESTQSVHILFFITRILVFIGVYIILHQEVRGDLPFFYSKASHAVKLELVYRDFLSFHAPLFSYLIALPLLLWHHPKSILLLMILGEFLTLKITQKLFDKWFNEAKANFLSCLYLLLPAPAIMLIFGGQEDIWLWGIFAWALYVYFPNKQWIKAGLILSLLLIALKITAIFIFIPIFFSLNVKNKIRLLVVVGLPVLLVSGLFYYFSGPNFFMFIQHTKAPYSPNFLSITYPFFSSFYEQFNLTQLNWAFLAFLFVCLIYLGFWAKNLPLEKVAPHLWIITFGLFNICLPASMIYYTYIYLIAIFFILVDTKNKKQLTLFLVFNLLIILQPYLYVTEGNTYNQDFSFFSQPLKFLEYIMEISLIGFVLSYCFQSLKEIKTLKEKSLNS